MKTGKWLVAAALAFALNAGLANAKIPVPPMDDAAKAKAKAEEAKVKAADAAKKDAEQLAKAQDRVADRYKKGQAKGGKAAPATKAAKPAAVKK